MAVVVRWRLAGSTAWVGRPSRATVTPPPPARPRTGDRRQGRSRERSGSDGTPENRPACSGPDSAATRGGRDVRRGRTGASSSTHRAARGRPMGGGGLSRWPASTRRADRPPPGACRPRSWRRASAAAGSNGRRPRRRRGLPWSPPDWRSARTRCAFIGSRRGCQRPSSPRVRPLGPGPCQSRRAVTPGRPRRMAGPPTLTHG